MKGLFLMVGLFWASIVFAGQPVELGKVHWYRSMDKAKDLALQTDKPIFILFQEVPGCSTCQNFGKNVLSHPIIVELIETYFIPLAIFNNKTGDDRATLSFYNEPSWNNPVLRIVDASKKDILPRHAGSYRATSVLNYIITAINKLKIPVPEYAQLIKEELEAAEYGTVTIVPAMYCFWTGEKVYGALNGVVHTQAGFKNGREIVLVEYDPRKITEDKLLKLGENQSCADAIFSDTQGVRLDRTQQYYLSHSKLTKLPLSPIQRTKINAAIGSNKAYQTLISPVQKKMLAFLETNNFSHSDDWKNDYFRLLEMIREKS